MEEKNILIAALIFFPSMILIIIATIYFVFMATPKQNKEKSNKRVKICYNCKKINSVTDKKIQYDRDGAYIECTKCGAFIGV
jgi:hypothetical protein